MLSSIPTSPEQLAASNQRILMAYYDIANYYRETLNDEAEAIKTYETMLARFPDNDLKQPVYYNLYRLYASRDPKKSLEYKNILLNQFPDSPFARVIKNPNYNRQTDEQETALHNYYNQVYESYVKKDYRAVLSLTNQAKQLFSENKLSPQLAYLNALALGHTEKLDVLDSAFRQIVTDFPEEKLIVPLVQQHLLFIDLNRPTMSTRRFALIERDPNEPRFLEEPEDQPANQATGNPVVVSDPALIKKADDAATSVKKAETISPGEVPMAKGVFTLTEPADYYFVVNVSDPSVNLSSSRFGIGQFNRANFPDNVIKHQLKAVNQQNQLIFVGVFSSREAVADYYRNINPLMREIMKIPAEKYSTFYVSKENLDKLTDQESINKYIEFYRQNLSRNE
jgi:hypothetical protein